MALEYVDYWLLDTDDLPSCEGKYEAILQVVCQTGNKSDVIPCGNARRVHVGWDAEERKTLEADVLAIANCTDDTYWAVADKYEKQTT